MKLVNILKLIFRTALLGLAILNFGDLVKWVFGITLAIEMMLRIIPNKLIPIGARKHFASSYAPVGSVANVSDKKRLHKGAVLSALSWLLITGSVLFALFFLDALTPQIVLIIALVYAVCDMVFIIFFCPFQKFFMKNRCCVECRIHNWDYFMMCAPLIIFPSVFSVSLFVIALAVLLRWEISLRKNPHFFTKNTNKNLQCSECRFC